MLILAAAIAALAVLLGLYLLPARRERSLARLAAELRESEEKLRLLSEHALDAIILADEAGRVSYWNAAAERMFGYSASEISGRSVHELLAAERYRRQAAEGYSRFSATGQGEMLGKTIELDARRKDGSEFPIELSISALRRGQAWNAIGIARDISERRQREQLFQLRAKQHAILFQFSKMRVLEPVAPDEALAWLAEALPEATQHPHIACARIKLDERTFATPNYRETPWRLQTDILVERRTRGQVEVAYLEPGAAGQERFLPEEQAFLEEVARDIGLFVRRIEIETELRSANRIVENSPVILYRIGLDPGIPMTYISGNVARLGYDPAQFLASRHFYQTIIHPDDAPPVRAAQQRMLEGAESESIEMRLRTSTGDWRWVHNSFTNIRDTTGQPRYVEGVLVDITERKLALEQLQRRDLILDSIAKVAADLLAAASLDAAVPEALRLAGEAVGADRVILMERMRDPGGRMSVLKRHAWNAPGIEPQVLPEGPPEQPGMLSSAEAFFGSSSPGKVFTAHPAKLEGPMSAFLQSLNIKSFLLSPILVEGEPWGYLTFDDCRREREWDSLECEAIQTMVQMIGAALARARHIADLADAKRIVENGDTVLYRSKPEPGTPVTYASANVSKWGYQAAQFTDSPMFYSSLVHPEDRGRVADWAARLFVEPEASNAIELRMRSADGSYRWAENRASVIRDEAGRPVALEGMLIDITERKTAADQLHKRDLILAAITEIAANLMAASSLDAALPDALEMLGKTVGADRAIVLEAHSAAGVGPFACERYTWNAPGVQPQIQPGDLRKNPAAAALVAATFGALPKGQVFAAFPRTLAGEMAEFLSTLGIESILAAPIPVEGRPWGFLGIDDCRAEREWSIAEREALKVAAEILGAAIGRARYITDLADAKRIVENTTTVVYRSGAEPNAPLGYISENVSKWGYRPDQFTASSAFHLTLVHPDEQAAVAQWVQQLRAGTGAPSSLQVRLRFSDGTYRWFENRVTAVRDAAGRLTGFEGMLIDIQERKQAETELDFVNTLLTTAAENDPSGFLVVDIHGHVLMFNQRFLEMWGVPPELAKTRSDEIMTHSILNQLKDPEGFVAGIRYLYQHPEEKLHDEIDFLDGRVFERHSASLYDGQNYLGRIWFFRDISERKQSEKELARLARTDPLTGLANRATFLERLDLAFAATRRGATPFAVLYLDLDRFKDVNDTLGHAGGDALLKAVARRLLASLRETDVAARFGGDEFAILQTDAADPSTSGALAAKIRASLADAYRIEGHEVRVTATVGIATYASEVRNSTELLEQADRALYRAKEEGRDQYRFHSQELDQIVHERISLAEELRAAIEHEELELYYQPQVDITSGGIAGMEALVRWNHPRRGQLRPGVFLPAAERTGVIVALGDWVLDRACSQFRIWRDHGVAPPLIAVNLSAAQLKLGRDFYRDVAAALAKWGLQPSDLEFDVPESMLAAGFGANPDALQRLRDLGVRLAIDDFGSEYTSIGRVKAYRVKRFKIAPQFIAAMTTDPLEAGVVHMMIGLARQLGIEIVAKSVETEEQQAFLLSAAHAAKAQGYFYSEPLSADNATELLRHRRIERRAAPEPALAGKQE